MILLLLSSSFFYIHVSDDHVIATDRSRENSEVKNDKVTVFVFFPEKIVRLINYWHDKIPDIQLDFQITVMHILRVFQFSSESFDNPLTILNIRRIMQHFFYIRFQTDYFRFDINTVTRLYICLWNVLYVEHFRLQFWVLAIIFIMTLSLSPYLLTRRFLKNGLRKHLKFLYLYFYIIE